MKKNTQLKRFWKYLDLENKSRICFQSDVPLIEGNNLSVDHVIPWSYMFSDDIWNLLYIDKAKTRQRIIKSQMKTQ